MHREAQGRQKKSQGRRPKEGTRPVRRRPRESHRQRKAGIQANRKCKIHQLLAVTQEEEALQGKGRRPREREKKTEGRTEKSGRKRKRERKPPAERGSCET